MSASPRPDGILTPPRPRLRIDGVPLGAPPLASLGPIRVRQEASAPAVCELDLAATDSLPRLKPGALIELDLEGSPTPLFSGEVASVTHHLDPEHHHRIRLRCFDLSHRLRQSSRITAYSDVSVADVVASVAAAYGLSAEADDPGPRLARVLQVGESDLALVGRLADGSALWWQVEGTTVRLRRWEAEVHHEARWGADLYEASVETDPTALPAAVRSLGWDPVERATRDATAGTGATAAAAGATGGAPPMVDTLALTGRVLSSREQAEGLARHELTRRRGRSRILRAVVAGATHWRPGVGLTITGAGEDLAGPYVLSAVDHVIDAESGYMCVVTSEPPPDPAPQPAAGQTGFTLARVRDVEDPEGAGRVKVSFPAWDDVESEWLPVLAAGAGAEKGIVCQPDVDDTVVVLYGIDDPGRGVVLGGLYADHPPRDRAGVRDGAVHHVGWTTAAGQRLRLDSDGDAVTLSNAAGSLVEFTQDGVRLHARADLTIEAPGKKLVLRADTVDFQRG